MRNEARGVVEDEVQTLVNSLVVNTEIHFDDMRRNFSLQLSKTNLESIPLRPKTKAYGKPTFRRAPPPSRD